MLRQLDVFDVPVVTFDELAEAWPAEEGERFKRLGLLREIEPARQILLTECEREPLADPTWRNNPLTGTLEGLYACGDDECAGIHYIEPDRMRQWAFSFEALALLTAKAIGADGRATSDAAGCSYFLGTVSGSGGEARDVFLTRTLWWKFTPAVLRADTRLAASSNATVLCVHRMPPIEQRRPSWHAVLALTEIVSLEDDGLHLPIGRMFEDQVQRTAPIIQDAATLTQTDLDVLEALAERPQEPQFIAQLVAASGYGRDSVMESLKRLRASGFVTRPSDSHRKGVLITTSGVERVGSLPKSG